MSARNLAALFLAGASALALEVSLTRCFSVMYFYHYAFLIIAVAVAGMGAGAVCAGMRVPSVLFPKGGDKTAFLWFLSAVTTPAALWLVVSFWFMPAKIGLDAAHTIRFILTPIFLAPPFFFMGMGVASSFVDSLSKSPLIYGANLAGSGAGAFAAYYILNAMQCNSAVIFCASFMAAAALLWKPRAQSETESKGAFYKKVAEKTLYAAALAAAALYPLSSSVDDVFELVPASGKMLAYIPKDDVIVTSYDAHSRVDIFYQPLFDAQRMGLWGLSDNCMNADIPPRKGITIDGWAYTSTFSPNKDGSLPGFIPCLPSTLAYQALQMQPDDSLIIGSGGGLDVYAALFYKTKRITAVEINPVINRLLKEERPELAGGLFNRPEVNLVTEEGRSYVESSKEKYDFIQLSGVDTYAATASGAMALCENYLYTTEAMVSYFNKLKPGGSVALTRWFLPDLDGRPRDEFKLLTLARDGLEAYGVKNPGENILYARAGLFTSMIVSPEPFPEAVRQRFYELCERYAYEPLFPRPAPWPPNGFTVFMNIPEGSWKKWLDAYPYDVAPPSDDRPFLFELRKPFDFGFKEAHVTPLGGLDGQSAVALLLLFSLVFASAVLYWSVKRLKPSSGEAVKGARGFALAGALIGAAFMTAEIALIQSVTLLAGRPVFSLVVVMTSVLFGAGAGGFLSGKFNGKKLWAATAVAAAAVLIYSFGLPVAVRACLGGALYERLIAAAVLSFVLGAALGLPFPATLARLSGDERAGASVYAANSAFATFGSSLAVFVSIGFGFSSAFIVSFVFYAAAAAIAFRLAKSA